MGGKGCKSVSSSCAFYCSPSVMPLQVNDDEEQLLFVKTAAHRKEVFLRAHEIRPSAFCNIR